MKIITKLNTMNKVENLLMDQSTVALLPMNIISVVLIKVIFVPTYVPKKKRAAVLSGLEVIEKSALYIAMIKLAVSHRSSTSF